jgi:hypothetical protein
MQTIYVKDYNVEVDFPDDMQPEAIKAALRKQFPAKTDMASGEGATSMPRQEPEPMPWSEVGRKALQNAPSSALDFGKAVVSPFIHPIDTLQGINRIATGAKTKIMGGEADQNTAAVDALKQILAERYGGYENIKRTLATDPVGSLADASTALTGGGGLAARLPGVMGKAGRVAANVGRMAEPVNLAKQVAVGGAQAILPKKLPMRWYESAVKPPAPTKGFTREQQIEALQAGLEHGILPTQKGVGKIRDRIDDLNDQIMGKIDEGAAAGMRIDTGQVVKGLDQAYDYFGNLPGADEYVNQINAIRDSVLQRRYIPIKEAQEIKQKIGTMIRKEYGKLSSATVEANKGIAYGIKTEIADIFPEITNLNKQESLMLRLEPIIEKAAARLQKRDLMGIGTPITGAAGGILTGSGKAGTTIMLTKAVLDHPSVKTYLAILLNKANKGGIKPGFVEERLAAYWADKMREASEPQLTE